jgi:hypothetical protein
MSSPSCKLPTGISSPGAAQIATPVRLWLSGGARSVVTVAAMHAITPKARYWTSTASCWTGRLSFEQIRSVEFADRMLRPSSRHLKQSTSTRSAAYPSNIIISKPSVDCPLRMFASCPIGWQSWHSPCARFLWPVLLNIMKHTQFRSNSSSLLHGVCKDTT